MSSMSLAWKATAWKPWMRSLCRLRASSSVKFGGASGADSAGFGLGLEPPAGACGAEAVSELIAFSRCSSIPMRRRILRL
eukprot:CAMPEP_0175319614 /NCGR_PEP_ID=MMETSP0093-20121207/71033_1 /TAXON_ID=311494 /ORGANISM="Alexandrium monilatum, Strain CCMP3105" /LENGTH=79 /DNA_ID=CAMNT_0016616443 /DNA_START=12 /DNA_END=247 /DNA_ORIENTATION=-